MSQRKRITDLQKVAKVQEVAVEKLKTEHSIDIEKALLNAQKIQQFEVKTMELTDATKLKEVKVFYENELKKMKGDSMEQLQVQREQFETRIAEIEAACKAEVMQNQIQCKKQIQEMKASAAESNDDIMRLKTQLETIQTSYGDITQKTAKIVKGKLSELEKAKAKEIAGLQVQHQKDNDLLAGEITKLKETYQSMSSEYIF